MRGTPGSSSRCRPRRPGSASSAAPRSRARSVRSASATVRCARCSTSRIETPRSRISVSAAKTVSTRVGERPSDGSSSRSTSGAATSARPIASCCCWPPESAPAWRSRKSASIGKSSYAAASGSEPLRRRRAESPSRRFSSTESSPKMRRPSGTSAIPARAIASGERPRTDWPDEADVPGRRRDDAHDRVQRRRLAGPVRPDQADELAAADLQIEPANGRDGAVAAHRGSAARARRSPSRRHSATALSPR